MFKDNFLKIALVSIIIALATSPSLHAEQQKPITYDAAGFKIHLSIPKEFCVLNNTNPNDIAVIEATKNSVKGINEVLSIFADCKELRNWHTGKQKYLDTFGNYQMSVKYKKVNLKGKEAATVKAICNVFKKQGAMIFSKLKSEVDRRMNESFNNIKLNSQKSFGVVYEDSTVCVNSTLQRLTTEGGSYKDQINLTAISVLNGRLVYSYIFINKNIPNALNKGIEHIKKMNQRNQLHNNNKTR